MSIRRWIQGFIGALIGGIADAAILWEFDVDFSKAWKIMAVKSGVNAGLWLKQHPVDGITAETQILARKDIGTPLLLFIAGVLALIFMCGGCATFSSHVSDVSPDGSKRETVTRVATFFDSKTELAKMKASQSTKDAQTVSIGALTQESSGTNLNHLIEAVVGAAVKAAAKP